MDMHYVRMAPSEERFKPKNIIGKSGERFKRLTYGKTETKEALT
jgi:hypothetical protein